MKHLKRIAALLFCLCLFASLTITASADTQYTLHANGGSHASGYDVSTSTMTFDANAEMKKINSSYIDNSTLYQCKGFHVAGDPTLLVGTRTFDHDVTLIAAYMLKDSAVQYTVRYVNAAGTEMLPSMVGYASEGDVIRVAYQYIENYQPQAYNLQMTMSRTGTNEIVFVYSPVTAQQQQQQAAANAGNAAAANAGNAAAANAGNAAAGNAGNAAAGNADNAAAGNADNAAGGEAAGADNAGLEDLTDTDTPLAEPEDLIDLDDEETPQALPNVDGAVAHSEAILRSGRVAAVAGSVGLVGAAVAAILILNRKKNHKG